MLFARTRWALFIWPIVSWTICALYLVSLLDKTAVELSILPNNLTIHIVYTDGKSFEYCKGLWDCGYKLCNYSNLANLTHLHIYPGTDCNSGITTLHRLYPLICALFLFISSLFEFTFILIFLVMRYPEHRIKKWLVAFVIIIAVSISLSYVFQVLWTNQIRTEKMDKVPSSIQIFDVMCTLFILFNLYTSHYSLLTKDKWVVDPL